MRSGLIRRFSGSWDLCVEQTSVYACAAGEVNCQSFKERKAEKVEMRERESELVTEPSRVGPVTHC